MWVRRQYGPKRKFILQLIYLIIQKAQKVSESKCYSMYLLTISLKCPFNKQTLHFHIYVDVHKK